MPGVRCAVFGCKNNHKTKKGTGQEGVMNQVGNSKFPRSGHLIFFSTNIRNENKTREIQKCPRARDRT
jgi:hypothetical protein